MLMFTSRRHRRVNVRPQLPFSASARRALRARHGLQGLVCGPFGQFGTPQRALTALLWIGARGVPVYAGTLVDERMLDSLLAHSEGRRQERRTPPRCLGVPRRGPDPSGPNPTGPPVEGSPRTTLLQLSHVPSPVDDS